MSAKREHRKRASVNESYRWRHIHWLYREPPKWKLLEWIIWKSNEPKKGETK